LTQEFFTENKPSILGHKSEPETKIVFLRVRILSKLFPVHLTTNKIGAQILNIIHAFISKEALYKSRVSSRKLKVDDLIKS
jgi:hypothetical protein